MANLFNLKTGKLFSFVGKLAEGGVTAEMAEEVDRNPALVKVIVEALKRRPCPALIHGVFNTTLDVLAAFRVRCVTKDIDFGAFSWVGSEVAPDFDPNDSETVVVLDAALDTLQNTFEFAWAWTKDGQERSWRWESMLSAPGELALLDGLEFQPWTLQWMRIKLDANLGKKPRDAWGVWTSPGCALLFMAAEHPERIKATDYEKRFGFWLPGLRCKAPIAKQWQNVPFMNFNRDDRQVRLDSRLYSCSTGHLAVPVRLRD